MHDTPRDPASIRPTEVHGLLRSVVEGNAGAEVEEVEGYEIEGRLGEGGMAVVYLAVQSEPVRREVALKVIKPGMDSAEVLARFEAERQVLAMMDHAGIARVHDAGRTVAGRPFFAMEVVDGPPLTVWCETSRLGVRERVRLFMEVCRAVQHAHFQGVLHRDLKPSNILVKVTENGVQPKVIDFGIAKALVGAGGERWDRTRWTMPGLALGTPEYMSPEQSEGRRDLDLRSDLYSLGVVLYELLAGTPPFVGGAGEGVEGLLGRIRNEEPVAPSEQARRNGRPVEGIAGDLDAIVLKLLEKDRDCRYASAAELVEDLGRHLRHEPVQARGPSGWYRTARWLRRHWVVASAVAAVWVAVLVALGVSLWQTGVARRERNAAERARERAERMSELILEIVDAPDPTVDGRDVKVIDVIRRTESRAAERLADDPETLAEIRYTLAGTFHILGDLESAERLYRQVLERFETALGTNDVRTAECASVMGKAIFTQGRTDEGLKWMRESVERLETAGAVGGSEWVWAAVQLSGSLFEQGRMKEAEEWIRRTLPRAEVLGAEAIQARAALLHNLAMILSDRGDLAGQRLHLEQAIQIQRELPTARVDLATALNNLGILLRETGDLAGAERQLRESLQLRFEGLGPSHPHVAISQAALSGVLWMRGVDAEAEALGRAALESLSARLPPLHRDRFGPLISLGGGLLRRGRVQEAMPYLRELMEVADKNLDPASTRHAMAVMLLGGAELALGNLDAAEPRIRAAAQVIRRSHPEDHPTSAEARDWVKRLEAKRAGR